MYPPPPGAQVVPLDMKGCICHFAKWQIHPPISKVADDGTLLA